MTNPILLPGVMVTWSFVWYGNLSVLPFAIGFTIIWIFDLLLATPTIPSGQLPPLYEIYIRTIFSCFKKQQLLSSKDFIPCIGSDSTHVLHSLDSLWDYDTFIQDIIDENQSAPSSTSLLTYLRQTPLERSEFKRKLLRTHALDDVSSYSESFLHGITKSMQRLHTIPLSQHPAYYLLPSMVLDASIQTFVHFPLKFWNATLVATDLTIFFAVPRGSQFFFSSVIISLRRGISKTTPGDFAENNDLLIDIQTQILVDKNRIQRGYDVETEQEDQVQHELDIINEKLTVLKQSLEQQNIHDLESNQEVLQLQEQHASLLVRQRTIEEYKQHHENLKKLAKLPPVMVLVATVVNTYKYTNALTPTFPFQEQDNFTQELTTFEPLIQTYLTQLTAQQQVFPQHPQLTVHTTPETSNKYAYLSGNLHPRFLNGWIPSVFGIPEFQQGQLDLSFATYLTLSLYHGNQHDSLHYGQSSAIDVVEKFSVQHEAQFALCNESSLVKLDDSDNKDQNNNDDNDHAVNSGSETSTSNEQPQPPPQQQPDAEFMYPYRVILQIRETLTAPATIFNYIGEESPVSQQIPHRGYAHIAYKAKKAQETNDHKQNEDDVSADISKESFPDFEFQRPIRLTVPDGQSEIVWVDGVLLHAAIVKSN